MKKILSFFAAMLVAVAASAAVINIDTSTANAIQGALNSAASGDEIVLAAGTYNESGNYLAFTGKELTVRAAEGAEVIIKTVCPVRLKEGAKAEFINIKFDCSTIGEYEQVIVAADDTENKRVVLKGCEFYGWQKNKAMIQATSSRRLAQVMITDCYFHDCMKSVVFMENTNPSDLIILNSTFANISTDASSFWAGVIDSRATSGLFVVDRCTFYNVLAMNTDYAAVGKVSNSASTVTNSIFMLPASQDNVRAIRDVAEAVNCITYNYLKDSGKGIHSDVTKTNCIQQDPLFVNAAEGNFTLGEGSPALTLADGEPVGDPRWVPAAAPAHTYTVAGSSTELFGEAWKPALEANDMELQNDGTYKWEKSELTLAAGAIEFKVCEDHAWTKCWPSQNYELNIAESGIYTITITFEPDNNNKVSAVATKTGSADVLPTVAMHGNFLGSWADTENFTVADDQKTASLKLTIAAGNYEFGMRIGGSGNWTSNGVAFSRENNSAKIVAGQGNLTLAADAAGDYIFTWTYETETLAITFPEAPALDAPAAAPADPTLEAYQVKAVYSAKYSADCSFGEWSSGTAYTQEEFGKKYVTAASGYFGLEFSGMNCSEMEKLHLDAWIAADASIRVVPIHGGTEVGVTVELKGQKWNSIDIDLSKFEGVTNWSNVYQIKIDNAANLTFWLNNVYFYTTQEKTVDLVDGYYLIGTMNGWDIHNLKATDKFAVNPENDKEYVLTTALAENNEFKVVAVANNALDAWYPGEGGNYKVDFAHAGDSKDIYFRPDYQGGEGWYANCIYVAENVNTNPYEAWFATGDTWNTETESYLEWNEDAKKATVHINVDKYGQWRAQVKYHGPIAEAGKYYRVALKMKSNNAIQNVTIKYQDNVEMIYVADAALEAGVEFAFDKKAAGVAGGNGIMVLDFGFAKAGDVIEIYDVVIEETEAPVSVLADGYYLIGTIGGVSGWTVADVKAENKFEQNPENNVEYMLNVTLAEGDELQVVNVVNDQISGDWFPGGEGNNYIVDADHAGEVTIYFRPDREGGDDWWKGCIYVDAKDEPIADCDWDNLSWIADGSPEQIFGNQFKVCVGNPAPTSIVNIQKPGWAAESGIYISFPSAAFGEISLPEGKYAIDGAGMVLYVSAFVNKLTDVTIVCDGNTYALTVYNDKGKDASAIESNNIAPKAVKLIENGQLYIILNGVRYNALGQME